MERSGTVTEFSFEAGLGSLTADDGEVLAVHGTAIADGSRDIAVGARVRFAVRPGHHGRWEAADIVAA